MASSCPAGSAESRLLVPVRSVPAPAGSSTVAVAPENAAARALYASLGFEERERREGYFASGPALLLSR
jgi:ribosomal protein S18 acetylase RimI-like enzyme